jgi:hypothetical protein
MREIEFGDRVFISHKKPFYLPENIRFEKTGKLKTIDDYNYKMLFEVYKYINTKFILIVHYDGFVIHPEMWRPEFLDFDYVGSPWPPLDYLKDDYGDFVRVGNGVSLRSRKLLELPSKLNIPFKRGEGAVNNEDSFICVRFRRTMLEHGIKYAPIETAARFGREETLPETKDAVPFLFHKWSGLNKNYKCFGLRRIFYFFETTQALIESKIINVRNRVGRRGWKKALDHYFNKYIKSKIKK